VGHERRALEGEIPQIVGHRTVFCGAIMQRGAGEGRDGMEIRQIGIQ
jgi:hypothetical protein